jgi:SOS-response transcriptional repressor LexA
VKRYQEFRIVTSKLPPERDENDLGICSRLKFLREKNFGARGKRKFAESIGLALSTYVNYENDRIPPSDVLIKVSEVTGCDLNWLMTGHGSMPAQCSKDPEISEILVRMEKIISAEPKARQAVNALMELLSSQGDSGTVQDLESLVEDKQTLALEDRSVIPILGRVAAGEPAPWSPQEKTSFVNLASMVSQLDAGAIKQKDSLGLFEPTNDEMNGKADIIELCEPLAVGKLMVDSFIVTNGFKARGELFAAVITGDSMEPILTEGDYVIADTEAPLTNGAIVLTELDKHVGAICKLYMCDNGHVMLDSYNVTTGPIVAWKSQVKWMVKVVAAIKKRK